MSGVDIDAVAIGIAGSHIYSFNSCGVVAVRNQEIEQADIDRAIEAAKAVIVPSNREIIHVIPQEFKVDNTSGIKNPLGMCGVRLEVSVHIVTGSISLIQNLVKCVELAGVARRAHFIATNRLFHGSTLPGRKRNRGGIGGHWRRHHRLGGLVSRGLDSHPGDSGGRQSLYQ